MKKTLKWINENFEELLMSYSLWAVVLIMGAQIIMRYIFRSSLSWSEELARYFFIWFAFLGVSHGVYANTHVKLDFIQTFFPKMEKPLEYTGDLIFIIFAIYMVKPGVKVIKFLIATKQSSPAASIPMYFVYVSLLVGIILTLLRFIQKYYNKLFNRGGER